MTAQRQLRFTALRDESELERARLCHEFYRDIYRDAFPIADEAEDPDTWLPLMQQLPGREPELHIIVASECGDAARRPLGGVVFEHYRRSGAWLITYLAIRRHERGRGLGRLLVKQALDVVNDGGARHANEAPMVFAEAERPADLADDDARCDAYRRLLTLEAFGFRQVEIEYTQPALSQDKPLVNRLLLLGHAPGEATELPAHRVATFLTHFYEALNQPDAPELQRMREALAGTGGPGTRGEARLVPLSKSVPAYYDESLGGASSVAVHFEYFFELHREISFEIDLERIRDALHVANLGALLSAGVESYHRDIVVPFFSDIFRPLVVSCEPFGRPSPAERDVRAPYDIEIDFPHEVRFGWEGRAGSRVLADRSQPAPALHATFVDRVVLFRSGFAAYSASIVFAPEIDTVKLNAAQLLMLESLVGSAGLTTETPKFSLRSSGPEASQASFALREPRTFGRFVSALMQLRAKSGDASIFLLCDDEADQTLTALRAALERLFAESTDPSSTCPQFVSVEVVGADRHGDVLAYARAAKRRHIVVDRFSKQLSGIVQNVLDFDEQDASEIEDSLLLQRRIGDDAYFLSARTAIWFSRYRRTHFAARDSVGGDPYWLLTRLVCGHNERLLAGLRATLDAFDREGRAAPESVRLAVQRMYAIRRRLGQYIMNPFRYPTERGLFEFFGDARGLERQFDVVKADEGLQIEKLRQDSEREKRRTDWRINQAIIALGATQVGGVILALLTLEMQPLWQSFSDLLGTHAPRQFIELGHAKADTLTMHPHYWLAVFIFAASCVCGGIALATITLVQLFSALREHANVRDGDVPVRAETSDRRAMHR